MSDINVATTATKNETAQNTRIMCAHEMLWRIQTEMEVKKTQNNKFSYFSVEEIMKEFHKSQKKYPCTLTMRTEWNFDKSIGETGAWMCHGIARLTNALDPTDFIEVNGTVIPSFSSNIGSREQQAGSTNTYAKKSALCNLLGVVSEQADPDEMPQTPQNSRSNSRSQTVKNTTLQSASAQATPRAKSVAQAPVQQTTAPAPETAPAPQASEPATGKEPIVFSYPGDGLTMHVSTLEQPLEFPQFPNPISVTDAMRNTFHLSDGKFKDFTGQKTLQEVMQFIFSNFDVEKLSTLSKYIKDQTSERPLTAGKLTEEEVQTLNGIASMMHAKLSKEGMQKQAV